MYRPEITSMQRRRQCRFPNASAAQDPEILRCNTFTSQGQRVRSSRYINDSLTFIFLLGEYVYLNMFSCTRMICIIAYLFREFSYNIYITDPLSRVHFKNLMYRPFFLQHWKERREYLFVCQQCVWRSYQGPNCDSNTA